MYVFFSRSSTRFLVKKMDKDNEVVGDPPPSPPSSPGEDVDIIPGMLTRKKMTQGWVVNGVRRHAEPLGDGDPPQLLRTRYLINPRNCL
jgi:hypothetical protein